MKHQILIIFIALFTFTLNSCIEDDNCVSGKGPQEEFDLELTDFDAITVAGAVNIELTQGPDFESILIIEPNLFEFIRYEVNSSGTLVIDQTNRCIRPETSLTLRVTAPDFRSITVAGVSLISNTNDLDLEELTITCAGAVISELSGTCTTQDLIVSGSGDFQHFDLLSDDININVSGSGEFDISVENNLDIRVSGSAAVNYMGDPTITQDVSGSLTLNKVN